MRAIRCSGRTRPAQTCRPVSAQLAGRLKEPASIETELGGVLSRGFQLRLKVLGLNAERFPENPSPARACRRSLRLAATCPFDVGLELGDLVCSCIRGSSASSSRMYRGGALGCARDLSSVDHHRANRFQWVALSVAMVLLRSGSVDPSRASKSSPGLIWIERRQRQRDLRRTPLRRRGNGPAGRDPACARSGASP